MADEQQQIERLAAANPDDPRPLIVLGDRFVTELKIELAVDAYRRAAAIYRRRGEQLKSDQLLRMVGTLAPTK
jgi:cytochrome c-type biogenesis protein CcmH/NrfG